MTPVQSPAVSVRVAIIGAGFSGLGMAIQLKRRGEHDFIVFEKEDGVGGTWRVNHYPGCACDVPSHLYCYSFEQNPRWSRRYAPQGEIEAYLEHCARKYGIEPHLRRGTELRSASWDAGRARWVLQDAAGQRTEAQVLVVGTGSLSTPAYPDLPGLARFRGERFHSQQWDHAVELQGRRVAVLGTGASAIQFVPQVQRRAGHVDLYQRSPPWILPRPDRQIGAREQRLFRRFPALQTLVRGAIYQRLELRAASFFKHSRLLQLAHIAARRHLHRQVADPLLRARLTPDYDIGCKRVLLSNDYYPALAQPNVGLITQGIRELREHSIVTTDGAERPADVLIFGTGFRATDPVPGGLIFGRLGQDLADSWRDGPQAYKGTTVNGFPNCFLLMGPNTGLGHNSMVYMIESQIRYVLDALHTMEARGLRSVEVRRSAQQAFNADLQARLARTVWNAGGCHSWYLHPSGRNTALWPDHTFVFRRLTRHFDIAAYALERAAAQHPLRDGDERQLLGGSRA